MEMDSRIRDGQNKFIDVVVHLIRDNHENAVTWCYPENGLNEELRRTIPKFAFPFCDSFKSSNIDYFTFVLTDIDGKFKFGFCRMSANSESTFCLVSSYPWFEIFYKILNHLADTSNSVNGEREVLLQQLSAVDPCNSAMKFLTYSSLGNEVTIQYPDPDKLPSIPESRNLTEYYNAIDGHNMLIIFASMLFERRIIVTSRKLSRLTACVYGATSLIYPLNWQHIFIPVLPYQLLDYISAPMPYLIGVHSSVFEMAKPSEIGDAVIVDADARKVRSNYEDLASLPSNIINSLKKNLNLHRNDNHCCLTGDKLSRAFLNAMVSIIGGYKRGLVERGGKICFDHDVFLHSQSSGIQPCLRGIMQSQSFEQFVSERIALLRLGKGLSDLFEESVRSSEEKSKLEKGSAKNKMVFVDIKRKVKSKGVKTFSSVKKKLEFKKNEHDLQQLQEKTVVENHGSVMMNETHTDPASNVRCPARPVDLGMLDDVEHAPVVLRRQQSSSRATTKRHNLLLSITDDNMDLLSSFRQRSICDLLTEVDRSSVRQQYSFDDLMINQGPSDHEGVSLSSGSLESCGQDLLISTQVYNNNYREKRLVQQLRSSNKDFSDSDQFQSGSSDESLRPCPPNLEMKQGLKDGDSLLNVIPISDIKVPESTSVFPSVRQLTKALQISSPVRRKAIISVQELPNVRQMVQKFESSSHHVTAVDALHNSGHHPIGDNSSSSVAHKAAMYASLDRKARSSLKRKDAVRATGFHRANKKALEITPGVENEDITPERIDNHRSSFMSTKSERYHDFIDFVKKERNSVIIQEEQSSDVDVVDSAQDESTAVFIESDRLTEGPDRVDSQNSFGCLLRVSTRSASMRQFDMEQRQFSCFKRTSPSSGPRPRRIFLDSRNAMYDLPTANSDAEVTTTDEQSSSALCQSTLYITFNTENKQDAETTSSSNALNLNKFVSEELEWEIVSKDTACVDEAESLAPSLVSKVKYDDIFGQFWSAKVTTDVGTDPLLLSSQRAAIGGSSDAADDSCFSSSCFLESDLLEDDNR